MKRICLITHTEASHSIENKVGGWYNSELTPEGRKVAASLVKKITHLGFNIARCPIYSSDLKRAYQTAKIIQGNSTQKIILEKRLREMSFGSHEGMNQNEHNQLMNPLSISGERMDHKICQGAESRKDVAKRTNEIVNEIMKNDEDVIVVTHGFAATFFIAAFQKIGIEHTGFINYKLRPGSITILEEDDVFKNRTVSLLNR